MFYFSGDQRRIHPIQPGCVTIPCIGLDSMMLTTTRPNPAVRSLNSASGRTGSGAYSVRLPLKRTRESRDADPWELMSETSRRFASSLWSSSTITRLIISGIAAIMISASMMAGLVVLFSSSKPNSLNRFVAVTEEPRLRLNSNSTRTSTSCR